MKYKVIKKWPGGPGEGEICLEWVMSAGEPIELVYFLDGKAVSILVTWVELDTFFQKVEERPMSWEELGEVKWYYIDDDDIAILDNPTRPCEKPSECWISRTLRPTKEMAEAQLALSQLMQLRDAWRDGWKPWSIDRDNYNCCFIIDGGRLPIYSLSFGQDETRDLFQQTFKDLIEKIKPLYFS